MCEVNVPPSRHHQPRTLLQGYLAHKTLSSPKDHYVAIGIGLL